MLDNRFEAPVHINWLLMKLAGQSAHLLALLRRLTSFGPPNGMKPIIFGKFLHILDEVAAAKAHEMRLLCQIEDIERKHRFMREHDGLKPAKSLVDCANYSFEADEETSEAPAKSKTQGFLRFLIISWILVRQKINQNNQSLTAT